MLYVGKYLKIGLLFISLAVIYAVTFALYQIPIAAVIYPTVLCIMVLAVIMVFDMIKCAKKNKRLKSIKENILIADSEPIRPESTEERYYHEIINVLRDEVKRVNEESDRRYREMNDYYTLWAHQIKTPIAAMRLMLQNEDTKTSAKLRAELMRVEQYVEMTMVYLRLDSDTTDYVFDECRIDDVIRKSIKKFAGEFITKGLSLEYTETDAVLVTDEKWLGFVIEQVISNALKYTQHGGVKVFMQSNDTICIEDSGIGIASEDLPRVFEKGYTGYNGRSDRRASGLGLYLCRRVCDKIGAEISVRSKVGQGSCVGIRIKQFSGVKE